MSQCFRMENVGRESEKTGPYRQFACLITRHHRLGQNELQGYLILFDPHAQTHDRQTSANSLLSQ